jgi:hypothetical protein
LSVRFDDENELSPPAGFKEIVIARALA